MSRIRVSRIAPYLLVLIGAGSYIINSIKGEVIEHQNYENLRNEVVNEEIEEVLETEESIQQIDDNKDFEVEEEIQETVTPEPEVFEEPKIEIISDELLNSGYEFQNVDFETLKDINEDACAWINIDGTNIDYPILQGQDNDYYLHHDIEGNNSSSGSVFVDYRHNSLDNPSYDLSDVTLIYGHHMKGGKMLANICKYRSQDYYEEHPFGIIYTPDGYAYQAEFFASMIVSGESDEQIYANNFEDEESFNAYIENIIANSTFESDVNVEYGDKIIGIVTCEYTQGTNSRQVLYAVLNKQYINELQIGENVSQSATLK